MEQVQTQIDELRRKIEYHSNLISDEEIAQKAQ